MKKRQEHKSRSSGVELWVEQNQGKKDFLKMMECSKAGEVKSHSPYEVGAYDLPSPAHIVLAGKPTTPVRQMRTLLMKWQRDGRVLWFRIRITPKRTLQFQGYIALYYTPKREFAARLNMPPLALELARTGPLAVLTSEH